MASLPTVEQGLAVLLKHRKSLGPVLKSLGTAKEQAQQAADMPKDSAKTLSAIRDEVLSTYGDSTRVAHLLSQYEFNRDEQMQTLCGLGADKILSLMAQGALPAEISKAIGVSYDTFTEFVRITCSSEELKDSRELGADSIIVEALHELESAVDKDDVAKARALMEIKLKIAKSMNHKYIEQKPSTAVQINNYDTAAETGSSLPFLQILEPQEKDLPALKPHNSKQEAAALPEQVVPTEYTLFEAIDD